TASPSLLRLLHDDPVQSAAYNVGIVDYGDDNSYARLFALQQWRQQLLMDVHDCQRPAFFFTGNYCSDRLRLPVYPYVDALLQLLGLLRFLRLFRLLYRPLWLLEP